MEGEINNFIMVWTSVLISLTYCHNISQTVPSGNKRLLGISPVIGLFFMLPLSLTTISLGGAEVVVNSFFLVHGLCVAVKIAAKKVFAGKLHLSRAILRPLAISFILATALWLFLLALLRCDAADEARGEAMAVIDFVKETWSVVRFGSIMIVSR
ncbi:hypothetical protein NL676_009099 [Syzygium grande]|nr:hypothetical protein NL676_009099 [Syzygium grande]